MQSQPIEPTVSKNIPAPMEKPKLPFTHVTIPLLQMKIGDSMFVPERVLKYVSTQQTISRIGGLCGLTFKIRRRIENGVEGYRIWRLESPPRPSAPVRIERNIPLAPTTRAKLWDYIPRIRQMAVGDSILIPTAISSRQNTYQVLRKGSTFKFVSREDGDGFRWWRIK